MNMAHRLVELDGEYAGWNAEMRESVSANILIELNSGDPIRALAAFSKIVVKHNFKGIDGTAAVDILDAPIEALTALLTKWSEGQALDPK
jgi:hypothetical protein